MDYSPEWATGLMFGGAYYIGNSGQDDEFNGITPSVRTQLFEGHLQYRYRQLELRLLGAWTLIDDADVLSSALGETIGERQTGWYAEGAYNVLPWINPSSIQYLAPFVRFESYDPQAGVPNGFERNRNLDTNLYTVGLTYKPIPQVALKFDYRNYDAKGTEDPGDEIAFGIGFAL